MTPTSKPTRSSMKQLEIKLKTKLMKIRIGLRGALGTVGYFFIGIPGTMIGLLCVIKIPRLKEK